MTPKVLIFAYRKPGLSLEEFKTLYEEHIVNLKKLAGDDFPLSHQRSYIARSNGPTEGATARNPTTPAIVMAGQQSDFDFDAQAELTFASQEALQAFVAKVQAPEAAAQIAAEEEKFLDRSKLGIAMLGDVIDTTK
jgi:EthD domain